jgi:hypothetical protein
MDSPASTRAIHIYNTTMGGILIFQKEGYRSTFQACEISHTPGMDVYDECQNQHGKNLRQCFRIAYVPTSAAKADFQAAGLGNGIRPHKTTLTMEDCCQLVVWGLSW